MTESVRSQKPKSKIIQSILMAIIFSTGMALWFGYPIVNEYRWHAKKIAEMQESGWSVAHQSGRTSLVYPWTWFSRPIHDVWFVHIGERKVGKPYVLIPTAHFWIDDSNREENSIYLTVVNAESGKSVIADSSNMNEFDVATADWILHAAGTPGESIVSAGLAGVVSSSE